MKRSTKIVLALALTAVVCLGAAVFAGAADNDPTVIFDASTKQFFFKNMDFTTTDQAGVKSQSVYPDLFPDMKGMMPGDSVSQTIHFEVANGNGKTVTLYLRAEDPNGQPPVDLQEGGYSTAPAADPATEAADPTNSDFNKLFFETKTPAVLTVTAKDGSVCSGVLARIGDDAVETPESGVLLGKFRGKETGTDLTVDFALPLEAGNDLQGLEAKLGWVIVAEITGGGGGGGGGEITPELNTEDHFAYIIGRPDGLVYPQNDITRAEVATIFFRMLTDASRDGYWSTDNSYSDVSDENWFNAAVSTMSNAGIISGYPDGTFRPDAPITRAEFATMAVRFFEVEYNGDDLFGDIAGHWAEEYINMAAVAELIRGYGDGTFRPDQAITRAEAITIFNRVLNRAPEKDHLLDDMIRWPDNMDTSAWYYAGVQEATNSHEYNMENADSDDAYEVWTKLLPVRDWAAFEKTWSDSHAADNPGEVVSSSKALKK